MADQKVKTIISSLQEFLTAGGSVDDLRNVVSEFDQLLKQEEKENTAIITTAFALNKAQQDQVRQIIDKQFNKKLDYVYKVDKGILAGIKIQVFDTILDMTLDNALTNINQSLKQ